MANWQTERPSGGVPGPNPFSTSIIFLESMGKLNKLLISGRFHFCILAVLILLQISSSPAAGLTDLDWRMSSSKYARAQVNNETAFHGANCADLSVDKKGTTVRARIYMDEPMPLEKIDALSLWVNPGSGDGKVEIEFYLDGDMSGRYESKDPQDARIRSIKRSWSELGFSPGQWSELDGFTLEYEKYGDKKFPRGSLNDFKGWLEGQRVVRIYITLYKDSKVPVTSALIDYIRVGDQITSFEPLEEEKVKGGPKSAAAGSKITYTITYGNNEFQPVNLVVYENYDPKTVFIESNPAPDPGTNNRWTIPSLAPGEHGQIKVVVKTRKPAAKADISGVVLGVGYTSTHGMLSTDYESYIITNKVRILAGNTSFSASVNTAIKPVIGSTLDYGEHGSGSYRAEEDLKLRSSSISAGRSLTAIQAPCTLLLPRRSISLEESWSAAVRAQNNYRELGWRDRYHEAGSINLSYRTSLGKTISYLQTSAQFNGTADRRAVWAGGFIDQRLAGNYSLEGEARWRYSSKRISGQSLDELDCGIEIGEEALEGDGCL